MTAPQRPLWHAVSSFFGASERSSLVTLLATGAFVVCCLVGAIFLVDVVHERDVATTDTARAATNLAKSLALQVSDTLEATNCALFGLGERVVGGPAPGGSVARWMAMQVRMVPRLNELLVLDPGGRVEATSGSGGPEATRAALDTLVRYHRGRADGALHVSGPMRGRDRTTWLIFASRRIGTADGRFAGVAVAELEVTYFAGLYANVDVGPRGTIALVSDGGIVAVSKPAWFVGRVLPDGAPGARRGWTGTIVERSRLDRLTRLVAYHHLADYPYAIEVSVAADDFLAQWRASALANTIAVAATLVLVGVLVTVAARQIGRRKRAEDRLAQLALRDGLTGLANRRRFDEALEMEWRRGIRDCSPLALLMIDVDNFKAYNDHYGHLGGDEMLTAVARTIGANVQRAADVAARYGGEEFAVILPATTADGALDVAERIRAAVVALGAPHAGTAAGTVTVSIGVAARDPSTFTGVVTLVGGADEALYAAKSNGRNCSFVSIAGAPAGAAREAPEQPYL